MNKNDRIVKAIKEDLMMEVGLGATYNVGSVSYPYYVSEVLHNGVIGIYSPDSHYEKSCTNGWTDGFMVVDKFDPSHPSDMYIRRAYGYWWVCEKNGKRIRRWHSIDFGHACSQINLSF